MPCKVLELTQHRWYVVRGTWGPRTEGRRHTTFPAHPRSSPTTPMAATSHRCIFPGSLSEIIDSRKSSSPALCLSQTCAGPLLLPTYQSSCKERRRERVLCADLGLQARMQGAPRPPQQERRVHASVFYVQPCPACCLPASTGTASGSGRPPYTKTRSAAQAFQPKELALTKKSDLNLSFRILLDIFCRILLTKEALYNVS